MFIRIEPSCVTCGVTLSSRFASMNRVVGPFAVITVIGMRLAGQDPAFGIVEGDDLRGRDDLHFAFGLGRRQPDVEQRRAADGSERETERATGARADGRGKVDGVERGWLHAGGDLILLVVGTTGDPNEVRES